MQDEARTVGIDFGFSKRNCSFGYSQFLTRFTAASVFEIGVSTETMATTLDQFIREVLPTEVIGQASLIAIDAPITPARIARKPRIGRTVERRFSHGNFSNGKRGPQPSSIAVPAQGWPLYCAAMDFVNELKAKGFILFPMPPSGSLAEIRLPNRSIVEVIPKLTQALLTPRQRLVCRPRRSESKFYGQIDNWLFPHLFVNSDPRYRQQPHGPSLGQDSLQLRCLVGAEISLDASVWREANRIQLVEDQNIRHELIGAFVAGFQGALALAGGAMLIGQDGPTEGYYTLPRTWHSDWHEEWRRTSEPYDSVFSVSVRAYT